ncbi:MAG: ABC transporter ATP-binding protein [Tepidiphilus sp.]|nr:ABC transporter ATP-binding protein [Tepidiphilus sp.]
MSLALEFSGVSLRLSGRAVLRGIDWRGESGRLIGLVGPNGAGKSMWLRTAAGVLSPQQGEVRWWGEPLARVPRTRWPSVIAYCPQRFALHLPLRALDCVALGLPAGRIRTASERERCLAALEKVDAADLAERPVTELSGGQQQRVALARAFAQEATMLLADEPLAALDPRHALETLALLRREAHEAGRLVVVALHELTLAARFCDEVLLLHEGRCLAAGAPLEVLDEARLREVYGLRARRMEVEGETVLLPWAPTQ